MATPFETVILKLHEIGFFTFLLYILTLAIFYGLLRRSQVFGKPEQNVAVNAIVALVAALLVWAYPIIIGGVDVMQDFMRFFFNGVIAILVVMMGLMISSMVFPEGLGKTLQEKWKGSTLIVFIIFGLLIAGAVFFSSGLLDIFWKGTASSVSEDVILSIVVVVGMLATVIVIVRVGEGGPKEEKKP